MARRADIKTVGAFDHAIFVIFGADQEVLEITSARDAAELLFRWPPVGRGPIYRDTRSVLHATMQGHATSKRAREAFLLLAKDAGILVTR